MPGVTYSSDPNKFYVSYRSSSRDWLDLRAELRNDAVTISKQFGPVYVAFSSGVDSQIITKCFLDQKLDAEYIFLHYPGYNDIEDQRVTACEELFKFKVRRIKLDIDLYKAQWIDQSQKEVVPSMHQYTFEWLSQHLAEDWPLVTQGSSEPAIIGTNKNNASIYHNYYDAMEQRFKLISKHRQVIDFPYSAESLSSYYTDDALKTFCSTLGYFSTASKSEHLQMFNNYAKPFIKGKYFKDIIWYNKISGFEKFPDWFTSRLDPSTRVSVPYWELVEFLETTRNDTLEFSSWNFS